MKILAVLVTVLTLTGCSSTAERKSFDDFYTAKDAASDISALLPHYPQPVVEIREEADGSLSFVPSAR
jgi:uncharacterized lipoprotein